MTTKEPIEAQLHKTSDEACADKQFIKQETAVEDENDHGGADDGRSSENKDNEQEHDGDDEDDDLEEGEIKDDDDDDDDEEEQKADANNASKDNDNNNDNNRIGISKDAPYNRLQSAPNSGGEGRRSHGRHYRQHMRRHISPNHQLFPGMHPNYPQNAPYPMMNMNNQYGFPPDHGNGGPPPPIMLPQTNHQPMGEPIHGDMYPGGPPGPVQKVNSRCRFYSRTNNRCTWGDVCKFLHEDDENPGEPGEPFDDRLFGPDGGPMHGHPPPVPPMGMSDRAYPPYRHGPYPGPMPPHPYGYGPYEQPPYGPHHSNSPPLPGHPVMPPHWRQQHSPYPPPSSVDHPPDPVSPSMLANSGANPPQGPPGSGGRQPSVQPMSGAPVPAAPSSSGAPSPGYSSPSSSSAVYERRHRLAYEAAPWNDRGHPPPGRYDRGDPAAGYYPPSARGAYYRGQYSRDPYGREPPLHMASAAYPYQQPNHRYPHYSSSHSRTMPQEARRSRSNKRTRDGDSSWSDTGSDDSILGEASSSSRSRANKMSRKEEYQRTAPSIANEAPASAPVNTEPADQGGSGTPPGEPSPEDRERQEMLLNKLKEIEDLMAKKKEEPVHKDNPL